MVVQIVRLPAWIVLLSWFLIQIVLDLDPAGSNNIAFKAHISGFVAGIVFACVFVRGMSGKMLSRIGVSFG